MGTGEETRGLVVGSGVAGRGRHGLLGRHLRVGFAVFVVGDGVGEYVGNIEDSVALEGRV